MKNVETVTETGGSDYEQSSKELGKKFERKNSYRF